MQAVVSETSKHEMRTGLDSIITKNNIIWNSLPWKPHVLQVLGTLMIYFSAKFKNTLL
jgi:hypothetical protein